MRPLNGIGAGALALIAVLAPLPALACTISLQSNGALRNSADNLTLGSQVNGSTPATLTTLLPLLSGVTIDVGAPTLVQAPGGYNASGQNLQVAYTASVIGLIQLADQGYTSSPTSFPTGLLGAVTVTMVLHNRLTNPSGFAPGTYTTRTLVTCHP